MIIQRRKFLIGLVSSLAAPAIVKVANIMPVKALFDPKATMQGMLNYYASAQLDVLYGAVNISPGWLLAMSLDNEFKITAISPNKLYLK